MSTTRRQFMGTLGAATALIGAPSILRAQGRPWRRLPPVDDVAVVLTAGWHERYLER